MGWAGGWGQPNQRSPRAPIRDEPAPRSPQGGAGVGEERIRSEAQMSEVRKQNVGAAARCRIKGIESTNIRLQQKTYLLPKPDPHPSPLRLRLRGTGFGSGRGRARGSPKLPAQPPRGLRKLLRRPHPPAPRSFAISPRFLRRAILSSPT